jgi:hypothetical protein
MDKETFLRLQYLRMMNSEDFVVERWRSSVDRFIGDIWDRTPTAPVGRFLEPIDPSLGFSPENVEYHFRRVRPKSEADRKPKSALPAISTPAVVFRPSRAERMAIKKAEAAQAREAKRVAIAADLPAFDHGALVRRTIKSR